MTKHAFVLGRELSIGVEASMLGSTPCSKNIGDGPIKWLKQTIIIRYYCLFGNFMERFKCC